MALKCINTINNRLSLISEKLLDYREISTKGKIYSQHIDILVHFDCSHIELQIKINYIG